MLHGVSNPLRDILFACCIQFLLYSCALSRTGVEFSSFAIYVYLFYNVHQMYPAVLLIYLIRAAVIFLASVALMAQCSVPYYTAGVTAVLYNFIRVFFKVLLV